jgi:hypothetical protein
MRTLCLAAMVIVLSGLPSAGGSFVPSASDMQLMNRAVSFELLAKGFQPHVGPGDSYDSEYVTIRVSIRNLSNKDLQAMTGDLQFNDAHGAAIESKRFDYVSVIKAASTITEDLQLGFNRYDPEDVKVRNAQVSDLRTVFYPEGMYFTDGVLLGSLWNSLYCRLKVHKGVGPCDFVAHPYE